MEDLACEQVSSEKRGCEVQLSTFTNLAGTQYDESQMCQMIGYGWMSWYSTINIYQTLSSIYYDNRGD